jgi:hypothetical protein
MYIHTEYTEDDIKLLEVIATTKKKIPEKNKDGSVGGMSSESTQSRTVDKSKIISSKNRSSIASTRVIQPTMVQVDPVKEKIAKACSAISLFNGIATKDIFSFMLQPKVNTYKDGDEILTANSNTKRVYIPISGEVCIIDESYGMYAMNGVIEAYQVFNLEETLTYRKNRFTYLATGSGGIDVISFSINEGMLASSPKLFAQMYKNISKELANKSLDKK